MTEDASQMPHEPPAVVDRGVSPIAGRFGGRSGRWITLSALAAGCGVFLFATWDRDSGSSRATPVRDDPARQLTPFEPARRETPPELADASLDPDAPVLTETTTAPALEMEPQTPADPAGPSPAERRRALAESARRAPVLAYSRATAPAAPGPDAVASPAPSSAPLSPLDALRQTAGVERTRAGRLAGGDLLITAGMTLPCVLQTAMDSGTPGYVTCVVPRDIYSDTGGAVLMERGTRVLGEYRGGLDQGRRRLFVLWTRAVTPQGVAVALASPASDALGRGGFDGDIDTHFWDRFGGALLLSIVDDGAHAAFGQSGSAGATRLPSDAAGAALAGSLDIPATLRKDQGAEVSIFVARDLDFGGVYRLRLRP